jgi:ElaB/YqjD/DUF883 family membrane-anchored ribosome-binding protein
LDSVEREPNFDKVKLAYGVRAHPTENDDMDEKKPESRTTAGEAIGSRGGDVVPDAANKATEKAEEAVRQAPTQAGSSTAAKTAEAVGERVSDAYEDPAHHAAQKPVGEASGAVNQAISEAGSQARAVAGDMLATGRQTAQAVSRQFDEQPFLTVLAGFGLGYIAGLLIHGRR